jgi:hypothetical protein
MMAAVVRSERCQRIPVKYSSEEPDSTRSAPSFWRVISACTRAIRPMRSSAEIACTPLVIDFKSVAGAAGPDCAELGADANAAAAAAAGYAPAMKLRLDIIVSTWIRCAPRQSASGKNPRRRRRA